ncbi:MAG TPA: hypothetical protein VJ998_03840, partial [Pseudomonadales bacterium]|nr:hypothetical protein [Pseudomonadales bacterium]
MKWVSFDPFRTQGFPDTTLLKPDQLFANLDLLRAAECVLFAEYWQIGAVVFALKRRVFPSLPSYLLGHDKIEMTRAFQALVPGHIPETRIAANTPTHAEALWQAMNLPFVAKLRRSAEGRGVWLIEDSRDWQRYLALTDVLYVQEQLPIDRDIRVVIVGTEPIASYWRLQSADGFHNNIARGGVLDYSPVPHEAIDLAVTVARELGVDHAGFDVAMVGSTPYLLEFNRLFGNQGIPGRDAFVRARILDHMMRDKPENSDKTPPPRLPR